MFTILSALLTILAGCDDDTSTEHPGDTGTDTTRDANSVVDLPTDPTPDTSEDSGTITDTTHDADSALDSPTDPTDSTLDTSEDSDTGGEDLPPDLPDVTDAGDTDVIDIDPTNPCQSRGGICLSGIVACTSGNGTHLPSCDSECVFDDGAGACCRPSKLVLIRKVPFPESCRWPLAVGRWQTPMISESWANG